MKKNILTFITISAIFFSACAQQKNATKGQKNVKVQASASNLEQVVMERTPCFGTCPAYRVEINKNGKVIYTSWSNTKYEGVYEKNFDAGEVAALFSQFDKYKVDTCNVEYNNIIPDVPGINFHFKYKGKEKSIHNAHFGPEFIGQLAAETDKFSQINDTWKKTAEAGQK